MGSVFNKAMFTVVAENFIVLQRRKGYVLGMHYHRVEMVVADLKDIAPIREDSRFELQVPQHDPKRKFPII